MTKKSGASLFPNGFSHYLTFLFGENEVFNHFMRSVSPSWERISRGISKKDCLFAYDIEKKKE